MPDSKTFEASLNELENIIAKLENGDVNLNECVELYKKGIELSALCSKMLDEAKQQVKMVSQSDT